jgi:hypothetical protein
VERSHSLVSFDIEAIGLKGDYNSILVVSMKPFGKKPYSRWVSGRAGQDRELALWAKKELEKYDCWISHYGKGFDIKMIDTRLTRWGLPPVERRNHVDLYFIARFNLLIARKSQAHISSWLGTPNQKMSVSANVWAEIAGDMKKHMPKMVKRCEADVLELEDNYRALKPCIRRITR